MRCFLHAGCGMDLGQLKTLVEQLIASEGSASAVSFLFCLERDVRAIDPSVDPVIVLDTLTSDSELEELQYQRLEAICQSLKQS